MKKLFVLIFCLAIVSTVPCAQNDDFIELMRSDIKTQKRVLITEAMQFSREESEAFWPVYKKYEYALSNIFDGKIKLTKDYAANYETMTDEKARALVHKSLEVDEKIIQLKKEFFAKFEQVLSPITTAKFFQVDNQINMLLNLQLASQLPLVKTPEVKKPE